VADQSVSVSMTLSDLERLDVMGHIFEMDLIHYACTIWSRMTKFGRITHQGRGVFSRGQSRPHLNKAWPQLPKFWGSSPFMFTPSDVELPNSVWEGHIFKGSVPLPPQGSVAPAPQFWGSSLFMFTPSDVELPNSVW